MRPADIEHIAVPSTPALRGELLLTGLSTPDPVRDSYRSSLRRVGFDGSDTLWSRGEADTAPAISPDGRWVAFLRASREDTGATARAQVHVMPAGGGEAVRVTEFLLGSGEPVWSPDSTRIAVTARIPEPGRYGSTDPRWDTEPGAAAEAPRRITRFDYRVDDVGFLRDRPARLHVVDVAAALAPERPARARPAEPITLTDGLASVEHPAWLDDETVLVVAPRDWDVAESLHSDIYAIPVAGGSPREVVRSAGQVVRLAVDQAGNVWFLCNAFDGFAPVARNHGLWTADVPPGGGGPVVPRRLTDPESVACAPEAGPPVRFGDGVLVGVNNRGAVELRHVPADAETAPLGELALLAGDRGLVRSFAADVTTIVAVISTPHSAGELVLLRDGTATELTDWSKPLRGKGILPPEELSGQAGDGYPVHGWLVRPEGPGPHPVLLVVHGGPFAAYNWGLFDEAQVYAAAGYAVVLPNPRGSCGYGEKHARAIIGRLGTDDAADVLALLDLALEQSDLDGDRVGVMGGSYGGFMTGWLAAHHGQRFRAAWSERAVNAWDSFAGSSDIGWYFAENYVGTDPEEQRARSPLTHADRIGIPFAVVHSEQDWRCPLEQAQRMFVALRSHGVETELLLFSGEGHELTRSGSPRHRLQRFEAVLHWWARHLRP
ncbi:dipeptidyl aminopeptidase [Amycolatopsis antarctica]|uniref:Dipeptidyl aminopeptidase n=1 Tax=Amycolatopsis antarctica TaxID=1854586 RepID=A0A263D3J0_9PSEU|nr:S9 family peptidase [Amycolatopsis antarctica]OZM72187.1 dipeptidyl aminopeptidase [Amycolatopsis antarctica]